MKIFALILLTLIAIPAAPAFGCSVVTAGHSFVANQQEFEHKHDFPIALTVPAPIAKVISVNRATSDVQGNCSSYALAVIEISVPTDSDFNISELAFVFRTDPSKPQDAYVAFPNFPIVPRSTDHGVARFTFRLIDPPETRSQPFELTIDIFAINNGLQVGPSTTALVVHP